MLVFVALLAVGIPIFLLVTYESAYADKVYPGVSVLGMPMAGMSRAEAEISLNQRFSQTYRQSLSLRFGDRVWPVTRDEIGLRFHVLPLWRPVALGISWTAWPSNSVCASRAW
jgi:hypothetical protein